jgi:nicotinamidase-related amidase
MESDIQNTALLVMDMQTGVLGPFPNATGLVNTVAEAIMNARSGTIPIIYIAGSFRPGRPDIIPNNKIFAASKEMMNGSNMDEPMKIHPTSTPLPHDIIIIERRINEFAGSDLEVVLRSLNSRPSKSRF